MMSRQESRRYPHTLEKIRRAAQQYGILHGSHRSKEAVDNDLYMCIGLIDPNVVATESLVYTVRRSLSERPPLTLAMTVNDLSIVTYEDERLPTATTSSLPVTEYATRV